MDSNLVSLKELRNLNKQTQGTAARLKPSSHSSFVVSSKLLDFSGPHFPYIESCGPCSPHWTPMRIEQGHKNRRALGAVKQRIDGKSCVVINVKQEGIWLDARKNFPT